MNSQVGKGSRNTKVAAFIYFFISNAAGQVPMSLMQTWVDVYPVTAERKGGHVNIETTKSVVTSNNPPWKMYTKTPVVRRQAFCERFTVYKIEMGCLHPKSAKCACPRKKTLVPVPQIPEAASGAQLYTGSSA